MVEHLPLEIIGSVVGDIAQVFLKHSQDKSPVLRQAACYGLGLMAQNTGEQFGTYSQQVLESLGAAIQMQSGTQNKTTFKHAKDNAISSIGKIIKHQNANIDVAQTVTFWFQNMPLRSDKGEAKIQNDLLADILQNQAQLLLKEDNSGVRNLA